VGAYDDDCAGGNYCGSAYVFRFNGSTWVQEQKLIASDAAPDDEFGISVAVHGNVVVVGAPYNDCVSGVNCGSAYVYRFNGSAWDQEQKLTASNAAVQDAFGISVSVVEGVAFVGAYQDNCAAGINCGSVYAYRFNGSTWVQEQKLTASDAAPDDQFGISVSVSGDVAVVGAYSVDCAAGIGCGSGYVYRFGGSSWVEEAKLTASDEAMQDYFGISVSVSGDMAVVGALYDDCAAGVNCGSGGAPMFL
jgi:type 1 fimbria pilin